ncbi:ABC transporter substrate-binding protein [Planctomonas psychrotolerans]|uniref:ABC transporter substrate-binding protein n=1 Tax=Planctomonas psychrotolerans TaxID=2528712 RepID=UPI001239C525|nr:ABC transporter substrate-binding protein [Planctomonas psychrotolerans]
MFKFTRAAVVAVVGALALAGCSTSGSNGGSSGGGSGDGSGGTLTWGVIAEASTFAQKDMRWANESPYAQAVYDTLLRATPEGEVEAGLATEWEYNEDRTVLTMTLRDDVTFTNGETLTAEDAAASLLAFKDGTSPNASNLVNLEAAQAVDDTTLELTLTAPDPALETYLTQNSGLVAPVEAIDDPATAQNPIGSGPYVLNTGETVVGSSYVFDRNADYWNPDDQHYDKLVLQYYADPTSLLNAIQGGQVNVSNTIDVSAIAQMEASGFTANEFALNWWGFLLSDRDGTIAPALADVRVRQAINYALDKEALVATVGSGYGTPTSQIFPPSSPSYDESLEDYYTYDLDRANELMAEAGFADGFEVTMPRAPAIPESHWTLYADQLAQIGITVNYEELQGAEFIPGILGGNYAMTWFTLQQDPTDYQLAQFQIAEAATWNTLHQSTPEVEAWIDTMQTGTEEEATEAGEALNAYIVENAWFAPMYRPTAIFMSDASTQVTTQIGNAVPYLWNVQPK